MAICRVAATAWVRAPASKAHATRPPTASDGCAWVHGARKYHFGQHSGVCLARQVRAPTRSKRTTSPEKRCASACYARATWRCTTNRWRGVAPNPRSSQCRRCVLTRGWRAARCCSLAHARGEACSSSGVALRLGQRERSHAPPVLHLRARHERKGCATFETRHPSNRLSNATSVRVAHLNRACLWTNAFRCECTPEHSAGAPRKAYLWRRAGRAQGAQRRAVSRGRRV